ncbi:MAG: hypothetical protein ABFD92_02080 [Planctomycetaceae bacterium]|nr:hypothetical protein [Planctomycetaceae bacterium]
MNTIADLKDKLHDVGFEARNLTSRTNAAARSSGVEVLTALRAVGSLMIRAATLIELDSVGTHPWGRIESACMAADEAMIRINEADAAIAAGEDKGPGYAPVVGEKLKVHIMRLLKARGINTFTQAAGLLGIGRPDMSKLARGVWRSARYRAALADLCGMSVSELFDISKPTAA